MLQQQITQLLLSIAKICEKQNKTHVVNDITSIAIKIITNTVTDTRWQQRCNYRHGHATSLIWLLYANKQNQTQNEKKNDDNK